MRRILIFIAFFVSIVSLISCGGSSSSSAPGGVNPGFPSDIQLLPLQYIAQTNSDIFFKARVLDGNGNPVSNVPVTFTNVSPIGTINAASAADKGSVSKSSSTVANTNGLGYATIRVFSSTPGFVTVQSEVNAGTGHVRERKTVYFTTSFTLNLQPTLTLDVDAEGDGSWNEDNDFIMLQNTGDDFVLIRVTVRDRFGLLASGVTVTFGADIAYRVGSDPAAVCSDGSAVCEITFNTDTVTTDSAGQATVTLHAAPEILQSIRTLFNVTATADNGAAGIVTLFLEPVIIDTVSMSANPGQVEPGGTSDITAFVTTNLSGIAPDNTAVMFTTTCGSVTPFGLTTNGSAPATFTAPLAEGSCTITGTAGSQSGSVDVIVSAALSVLTATQTINGTTGGTATYTIFGGTPSYDIFTSNPLFPPVPTTVGASGGTFSVTVPAGTASTTVTYTVMDAAGATETATLVIIGPGALAITPDNYDLTDGLSPQTFIFQVTGGVPNYTVTSGSPGVVFNDNGAGGGTAGDGIINGTEGGVWILTTDGELFTATVPANAVPPLADTVVTLQVTDSGASAPVTATLTITAD